MKFHQILVGVAVFLTACSSSQKYAYHFDHYDYQSGRRANETTAKLEKAEIEHSPIVIHREAVVASAHIEPVVAEAPIREKTVVSAEDRAIVEKFKAMSKAEKKAFRKELKKELLSYAKKPGKAEGVESVKAVKAFDALAGLAIVFGGAGIVMIMLAGVSNVFWVLGAISLVIGAFLFVRWVANGNG